MHTAPFPVEFKPARSARGELNEHRNVFCSRYSGCLDLALRRGWDDFSCHRCALYHAQNQPKAEAFALEQPHHF